MQKFEYLIIKTYYREEKWYVEYLGKAFDKDMYFDTIINYVGMSGWELVNSTAFGGDEMLEIFYLKRLAGEQLKFLNEKLFNKIDQFTHFSSAKRESEADDDISDEAAGKKVMIYFYDWLKHHHFKWDDPAPGVTESHYLVMLEDASKIPQFFDEPEELQNVTTRIDVDRHKNSLIIRVNKRAKRDKWYESSKFVFGLSKEGLDMIRYTLGIHHTWINRLNGLDKF